MLKVDNTNSGDITFKAANSGNYTLVFPEDNGTTGQVLSVSDGKLDYKTKPSDSLSTYICQTFTTTSSSDVLITSVYLPAGTYTEVKSVFGTMAGAGTCTFKLKVINTTIKSLTNTSTISLITDTGFVLASDAMVDIYINTSQGTAIFSGAKIK